MPRSQMLSARVEKTLTHVRTDAEVDCWSQRPSAARFQNTPGPLKVVADVLARLGPREPGPPKIRCENVETSFDRMVEVWSIAPKVRYKSPHDLKQSIRRVEES